MLPVGPLMTEHRLIERMIKLMDKELQRIKQENKADPDFIEIAADFLKSYADRFHHGKEEYILFRDLAKKKISEEHARIMDELIKEHMLGRNNVKKLIDAKEAYVKGNEVALNEIIKNMEILVKFYPTHIEKEDKQFFVPCTEYLTGQEKDSMLKEMREFDRNMIHEKYTEVVEGYEKRD